MGVMQDTNAGRAAATYDAMRARFSVNDGRHLYRLTAPHAGAAPYAYLWEFSRALLATLALAGMPTRVPNGVDYASAVRDHVIGLEHYWSHHARPGAYESAVVSEGGGDLYYDDNAWIGLGWIQLYRMGFTTRLDRAAELFRFAQAGWDSDDHRRAPGGIFWVQQGIGLGFTNHDRGTGATVGNAELGLHLLWFQSLDHETWPTATNMADWVWVHLRDRDHDGLYANAVLGDGRVDSNLWTYNQGVTIGANVLQFQLTEDPTYLSRATRTANAALGYFGDFQQQPPPFNSMFFQNLLMLHRHADATLQAEMLRAMQAYADWAWNRPDVRDPATDLFYFDDAGRPSGGSGQPAQLRDQGAMAQLYALLAWDPSDYIKLT